MAHGHGASSRRGQQRGARLVQMTDAVHPRVCVSGISTWNQSLVDDLALYEELGIHTIGVTTRKVESEDDIARVRSSGLTVANVIGVGQAGLARAMSVAAEVRAPAIIFTTGPAGALEWDEAADRLESSLDEVLPSPARSILSAGTLHHGGTEARSFGNRKPETGNLCIRIISSPHPRRLQ